MTTHGHVGVRDQVVSDARSYDDAVQRHEWSVPPSYNIADDVLTRWATDPSTAGHLALQFGNESWTWAELHAMTMALVNTMRSRFGVAPGDTVAVVLPPSREAAVSHMAAYFAGAILCPISRLLTGTALAARLRHSASKVVITDAAGALTVAAAGLASDVDLIVADPADDAPGSEWIPFDEMLRSGAGAATPADTRPDSPALLLYTSGTTGAPKGVLHGQRVALGHATASYLFDQFREGDRYWSSSDWSWIAGAGTGLMAPWGFGIPVLTMGSARFEPSSVVSFVERQRPTVAFLPPTALRMLRHADVTFEPPLRCLLSGGEAVSADLVDWALRHLTTSFNVGYGQSEGNLTVGSVSAWEGTSPSGMGRVLPGHDADVVDAQGTPVEPGETGELAFRYEGDPTFMLGYLDDPEATARTLRRGLLRTGDMVERTERGFLRYCGRSDDIIKSAGYRIGPSEVEAIVGSHPAILECVVIGLPDDVRGHAVTVVARRAEGSAPQDEEELLSELSVLVSAQLGPHARPRRLVVVDRFPTTATGKISRRALRDELSGTITEGG